MEKLPGKYIGHAWKLRSPESQAKILQQLRQMVDEMRRIMPPSPAVANVDGGELWDCRLPGKPDGYTFGPFDDVDSFHRHLRGGTTSQPDRYPDGINESIRLHNSRKWPAPVFTHGDLSSLNILAEGDTITGIVDWETAGWYPHYWEYTTACYVNPQNPFWLEEIDKFLEPFPEENRMEKLRRTYFGDI